MRPFKDLKEFTEKTGKTFGSIIRIRYKENHDDIVTGIITGYDEKNLRSSCWGLPLLFMGYV